MKTWRDPIRLHPDLWAYLSKSRKSLTFYWSQRRGNAVTVRVTELSRAIRERTPARARRAKRKGKR